MNRSQPLSITPFWSYVPRVRDIVWKEQVVRLYSVGWLSYLSQAAKVTLRLWERKKLLPAPLFTITPAGRWYTPTEITQFSSIIREHYQTGRDRDKLRSELHRVACEIRRNYQSSQPLPLTYLILQTEGTLRKAFTQQRQRVVKQIIDYETQNQ